LLGVKETNAVEQAIHDRVKKNIGQATSETFMKTDPRPIVFQNVTLIKMQLNLAKAQFRQSLENLERAPEEHRIEFMKEVGRILPTAVTLIQETRDPELEALIKRVEDVM